MPGVLRWDNRIQKVQRSQKGKTISAPPANPQGSTSEVGSQEKPPAKIEERYPEADVDDSFYEEISMKDRADAEAVKEEAAENAAKRNATEEKAAKEDADEGSTGEKAAGERSAAKGDSDLPSGSSSLDQNQPSPEDKFIYFASLAHSQVAVVPLRGQRQQQTSSDARTGDAQQPAVPSEGAEQFSSVPIRVYGEYAVEKTKDSGEAVSILTQPQTGKEQEEAAKEDAADSKAGTAKPAAIVKEEETTTEEGAAEDAAADRKAAKGNRDLPRGTKEKAAKEVSAAGEKAPTEKPQFAEKEGSTKAASTTRRRLRAKQAFRNEEQVSGTADKEEAAAEEEPAVEVANKAATTEEDAAEETAKGDPTYIGALRKSINSSQICLRKSINSTEETVEERVGEVEAPAHTAVRRRIRGKTNIQRQLQEAQLSQDFAFNEIQYDIGQQKEDMKERKQRLKQKAQEMQE